MRRTLDISRNNYVSSSSGLPLGMQISISRQLRESAYFMRMSGCRAPLEVDIPPFKRRMVVSRSDPRFLQAGTPMGTRSRLVSISFKCKCWRTYQLDNGTPKNRRGKRRSGTHIEVTIALSLPGIEIHPWLSRKPRLDRRDLSISRQRPLNQGRSVQSVIPRFQSKSRSGKCIAPNHQV